MEKIFFSTGACLICHTGDANDNVIVTALDSEIHATLVPGDTKFKV